MMEILLFLQILPEWAPNIHPLIIHFPIAVLTTAVLFDFIYQIWDRNWLSKSSLALYLLGALSSLAAFLTGILAADSVNMPMQAELTVSNHSDMAQYTLIFFALYSLIRILFWWKSKLAKLVKIAFFIFALLGLLLLFKTADLGGKLVYKYGVGIAK